MQEKEEESSRLRALVGVYRTDIIQDLTVSHVIPTLLQELVINYEEKQLVDTEPTYVKKAAKLLDILIAKSKDDFRVLPCLKKSLQNKYPWLYDKLCEDVIDNRIVPKVEINGSSYKSNSEIGGVPCLPTVNIERKDLLNDVVTKLSQLKRNQYMVIQGMTGCGKSVLATQAIHKLDGDTTNSKNQVYWLSMGKECSDSNDVLLTKIRILCDKLEVNRAPKTVEQGKEVLRRAYTDKPEALLVLDNVWSNRVIRSFDVGCRIMVTTQDLSVMDVVNGRLASSVHVQGGFQENESLNFFCEALNISRIENLPEQAKMIHNECKGSPMVISLIASLLEDHKTAQTDDTSRWTHYYESLSKRKFSGITRHRSYQHANIFDALSLSFDNLDDQYKSYYQDFGLFQDDVEIPCKVLETLWSKTKHEVEDVMKTFVRKSLAMEQYDSALKSLVYSVHDLQLDYLKYRLASSESQTEKDLHSKFIDKYEKKCNNDFRKLPDDGYIHFHIGYHLCKSGRFEVFPKIYLDLKFLGEKLRITGPGDVLIDFRKYRNYIKDGKDENRMLLEEMETFLQQVGYKMYGRPDVDIIQMAIQFHNLPLLSQQARNMAGGFPNRMYIDWRNSDSRQWKDPESSVLCGDNVCTAKFVGCCGNLFVVGLSNGEIKLCDFQSASICHVFRGHRDSVNSIAVLCAEISYRRKRTEKTKLQSKKHILVSASSDHTCKLWDLNHCLDKYDSKTEDMEVDQYLDDSSPSPKIRPNNRSWNFGDDSYLSMEFHTAAVKCVEFSHDGTLVVSTSQHELLMWSASNGTVLSKFSMMELQTCHLPIYCSDYIVGTTDTQIVLISAERPSIYGQINAHFLNIVALLFRNEDSFCTVSENEINLWKILVKPLQPQQERIRRIPLSPMNSVPIVNGNSYDTHNGSQQSIGGSQGSFLHPENAFVRPNRSNRSSRGEIGSLKLSGRTSPTSSMDVPDSTTTQIEVGGKVIQIIREANFTKENAGLFHSAALDVIHGRGDLLACGTYDHKIHLFQLDRLTYVGESSQSGYLGEFAAHNGPVTTLCFSPVEEFSLLSASDDQTTKVWDIASEEKEEMESKKTGIFAAVPVNDHTFLNRPDFLSICATDKRTLQVYKGSMLLEESGNIGGSEITCVALFRDGTHGVVGTADGEIFSVKGIDRLEKTKLDSAKNKRIVLELIGKHESSVEFVKFGYCNNVLATGSSKDVLVFQDFHPYWKVPMDERNFSIVGLHFGFRDSTLVICGQNGFIGVKDVQNRCSLKGQGLLRNGKISCSSMHEESCKLVIGSEDGLIRILNMKENFGVTNSNDLQCKHVSFVRSVALSQDGGKMAVGHDNGLITIWNLYTDPATEEQDLILHKHPVRHLIFSEINFGDEPWLLSCGDQLAFWCVEKSLEKLKKTTYMEERRRRKSGDNSRSSSRMSMEIPADAKVGRQGKRELLQTFLFHGNSANHVACDSSFSRFVTVDNCGVFYILDVI